MSNKIFTIIVIILFIQLFAAQYQTRCGLLYRILESFFERLTHQQNLPAGVQVIKNQMDHPEEFLLKEAYERL